MTPLAANSAAPEAVRTQSRAAREFVDRRLEPRLIPRDAIPAQVRIGEELEFTVARILDISPSGVRLGMERSAEVGSIATVWFHHTVATGRIRYCRPDPDGWFEAGLRLLDVLNRM